MSTVTSPKRKQVRITTLRIPLFGDGDETSATPLRQIPADDEDEDSNFVISSCMSVSTLSQSLGRSYDIISRERGMPRRSISFGDISCRKYSRTAGLNPSVSSGPALDLDWTYETEVDISLDLYESTRVLERRNRAGLVIPRREREDILRYDCELPRSKIASHIRRINRVKAHRRQTLNNLQFAKVEEIWQSCKRKISRLMCLRKSRDAEMKHLWRKAASYKRKDLCLSQSSVFSGSSHSRRTEEMSNSLFIFRRKEKSRSKSSELDNGRHATNLDAYGGLEGTRKHQPVEAEEPREGTTLLTPIMSRNGTKKKSEPVDSGLDQARHSVNLDAYGGLNEAGKNQLVEAEEPSESREDRIFPSSSTSKHSKKKPKSSINSELDQARHSVNLDSYGGLDGAGKTQPLEAEEPSDPKEGTTLQSSKMSRKSRKKKSKSIDSDLDEARHSVNLDAFGGLEETRKQQLVESGEPSEPKDDVSLKSRKKSTCINSELDENLDEGDQKIQGSEIDEPSEPKNDTNRHSRENSTSIDSVFDEASHSLNLDACNGLEVEQQIQEPKEVEPQDNNTKL